MFSVLVHTNDLSDKYMYSQDSDCSVLDSLYELQRMGYMHLVPFLASFLRYMFQDFVKKYQRLHIRVQSYLHGITSLDRAEVRL